jgi:hypothetical protein
VEEGHVTAETFNSWYQLANAPSRAVLVAEWTSIRGTYSGVRLSARPSTASEQKLYGAYLKMRTKCDRYGFKDVVPAHIPDSGKPRSRSRGRPTNRDRSPSMGAPSQPKGSQKANPTEQQLTEAISAGVRAALGLLSK